MAVYISVGRQIMGAFSTPSAALKGMRLIAPGCKPSIKKCRYTGEIDVAAKLHSNEVPTNKVVSCKCYPRLLKTGEFTL